jgi:uncharacterized RDD family membrane protein YckC
MENTSNQQAHTIDHRPAMLEDRALDGVLGRRVMAFLIDYVIVGFFVFLAAILVFFLGVITLGLGWFLYAILVPAVAAIYVWNTLGGPNQATVGMQAMNIRLVRMQGAQIDGLTAAVHTLLFWGLNVALTPLILLATLFLDYKRTVHDLLLGTVVVRTDR